MHRTAAALLVGLVPLTGCPLHVIVHPTGAEPVIAAEPARPTCTSEIAGACATETVLATVVQYMTFFAEMCGALIIAVGVVRALFACLPHMLRRGSARDTYADDIRLQLGKALALALEFELAADILKTAVAPTLAVIGQLAAIIVLRTMLNYFLERELRHAELRANGKSREGEAPAQG